MIKRIDYSMSQPNFIQTLLRSTYNSESFCKFLKCRNVKCDTDDSLLKETVNEKSSDDGSMECIRYITANNTIFDKNTSFQILHTIDTIKQVYLELTLPTAFESLSFNDKLSILMTDIQFMLGCNLIIDMNLLTAIFIASLQGHHMLIENNIIQIPIIDFTKIMKNNYKLDEYGLPYCYNPYYDARVDIGYKHKFGVKLLVNGMILDSETRKIFKQFGSLNAKNEIQYLMALTSEEVIYGQTMSKLLVNSNHQTKFLYVHFRKAEKCETPTHYPTINNVALMFNNKINVSFKDEEILTFENNDFGVKTYVIPLSQDIDITKIFEQNLSLELISDGINLSRIDRAQLTMNVASSDNYEMIVGNLHFNCMSFDGIHSFLMFSN